MVFKCDNPFKVKKLFWFSSSSSSSSAFSLYLGGYAYVTVFNFPPVGSHIPSSGRCMLGTCLCVAGNSQILFLSERQDLLSPCMILNACVHRLHP